MNTPHKVLAPPNEPDTGKEIGAHEFMVALHGKFNNEKYGLKGKKSIVQNIIEVRTALEQFEEGGLPGKTHNTCREYLLTMCSKH